MSYQPKLSSNISGSNFFFKLTPIKAWKALLYLALAISIGLLIGGSVAIITFPVGSLAVGWLLYRRYPLFYCSFTLWMWLVGPLIRRIIDFRCGYLTPGSWQLTPLLVTSISILTIIKHTPKAHKQGGLPFVIPAACSLYGCLLSIINDGFSARLIVVFLGWLVPVVFGFHIFIHWQDYPSYRQNIQRTFLWGVLFMGFYGIIQYVFAPPWDCFYLIEHMNQGFATASSSFGIPEPFGIRVFSSMTSPQDFAATMTAGLILLFCIRGNQQALAGGFGYLSFLLSLARSAWISWIVSILAYFRVLKSNLQIRMMVGIMVTALLIVPIVRIEPFSTVIGDRITSLTNADSDGSYQSRLEANNVLIGHAITEFVGQGIQHPSPNIKLNNDFVIGDNNILLLWFALGWTGALPYTLSIMTLIFQIRQICMRNSDLVLHAVYAVILGLLSQIFFKTITDGAMAIILWGFIGIGNSARNYYLFQNQLQKSSNRLG
ncbi:MAG TPA: hypothetical protein V6C71_24095 [Coleofasciculaceae cyanobacterium]